LGCFSLPRGCRETSTERRRGCDCSHFLVAAALTVAFALGLATAATRVGGGIVGEGGISHLDVGSDFVLVTARARVVVALARAVDAGAVDASDVLSFRFEVRLVLAAT